MSIVVLLGAGASFGSTDILPSSPPLGRDTDYAAGLFTELEKLGGVAARLPARLRSKFKQNFEEGMKEYHDREQANINDFQKELAQYLG